MRDNMRKNRSSTTAGSITMHGRSLLQSPLLTIAVALSVLVPADSVWAWGPHTEITRAALAVVPNGQRLRQLYGDDWDRIARDYCWMGDWREAVRPDHYADDYLLFPSMPGHVSHMLPEVRRTYVPFFRRALQALRTESPQNAARWVGSLLHFLQDSGSPPHTAGITGAMHSKMERWVDESQISIAGYEPELLGHNDAEALERFQVRMESLISFSRARAEKLAPILNTIDERQDQPLELESALETARVTADVLHTLFTLGRQNPAGDTCRLDGRIHIQVPVGYATVPGKIMLLNTPFSTTTDSDGRFVFRNLPTGEYSVAFLATGQRLRIKHAVLLSPGSRRKLDAEFRTDEHPGNLVRNPDFALRWIRPDTPDFWSRDPGNRARWTSALIRVPRGRECQIDVEFIDRQRCPTSVRWRTNPAQPSSGREIRLASDSALPSPSNNVSLNLAYDESLVTFEKDILYLEIVLKPNGPLADTCRHVSVTFVPRKHTASDKSDLERHD